MITKIIIRNFKKLNNHTIELKPESLTVVVGGNNAGKSSVLQALAIWNYGKQVITFYKKRAALNTSSKNDGVGVTLEDFTPLNIPSFEYLWTNLTPGQSYSLRIKAHWLQNDREKFLEIGLSLVQARLYIKKTESNLLEEDYIPEIAYLPPFAGISEKEPWLTIADRRKQIGRGLSGRVLRNLIYDYYQDYLNILNDISRDVPRRNQARERESRLRNNKFKQINEILGEVFSYNLFPENFSVVFNSYLKVPLKKGKWNEGKLELYPNFSERDIMAEGRGFLQFLSTLCLLFDDKIDILLLDEPDAHLHATLQIELINRLQKYVSQSHKQVLIATHSSEVLKSLRPTDVLEITSSTVGYCRTETSVRNLLLGLGVEHFPLLHKIQITKKIVFVEAEFDKSILKAFAEKLNKPINDDIVFWAIANKHNDRKHLFKHLQSQITNLKVISLLDRDEFSYGGTNTNLSENGCRDEIVGTGNDNDTGKFCPRRWRRWEMESYLIHPKAIASISNKSEFEIINDLQSTFNFTWPSDYKQSDRTNSNKWLFDMEGKSVIECFEQKYGIIKHDIPKHYNQEDIPDDVIEMVNQINQL